MVFKHVHSCFLMELNQQVNEKVCTVSKKEWQKVVTMSLLTPGELSVLSRYWDFLGKLS